MVTDAGIEVMSRKLQGLRKIDIAEQVGCSDRSLIALFSNCELLHEIRCVQDDLFTFENSMIYATSLHSLVLEAKEDHDRLLSSISTSGIRLEKILIYDDSGLSFHGLSNFLCGCPSLTHLTLCFNNFLTDNYMRDLCRYLPNLVSIKFNRCSNITIATFFILAKECPMLSKIGLPNIKPQVEDDFNLELKRNYRIRSLDLTCSVYLNDEFIKKVGAVCPNLQTLNLNGLLSLTTEGIGEILRCCSQIKHLIVDRTRDMVIFLKQFKTRHIKNGHGYNLEGLYD
ncbi:F-box/LRR-repeat protein 20-like [Camellia sinensis]|uniref:F-box/LRR-repeat protein 20-like n=1 Tax=Camellia sinensis TaxID=4442 RepID=UPI00103554BB|nr:F-box/LRR-repeat protein 20-like [Camellia sinensis]